MKHVSRSFFIIGGEKLELQKKLISEKKNHSKVGVFCNKNRAKNKTRYSLIAGWLISMAFRVIS